MAHQLQGNDDVWSQTIVSLCYCTFCDFGDCFSVFYEVFPINSYVVIGKTVFGKLQFPGVSVFTTRERLGPVVWPSHRNSTFVSVIVS